MNSPGTDVRPDIASEIEAGQALIGELPMVLDLALIGSAMYLPDANDVDFAVLIEPSKNAVNYAMEMHNTGWGACGEYDGQDGTWAAVRRDRLNLMITHDPKFFDGFKRAMQVCKALKLRQKLDRIAVCQIVRDGKQADDVQTHYGDAREAASRADAGWRPIETAPRDGTHVIVSDGNLVSVGGWVSDIDHGADYEGQLGMAGWWSVDLGPNGDRPTHWMPLPAAPAIEAQRAPT